MKNCATWKITGSIFSLKLVPKNKIKLRIIGRNFSANYNSHFCIILAERPLVHEPIHMVRDPLVEEDAFRSHYKVMEESKLDVTKFGAYCVGCTNMFSLIL